jgi:hypothetical protein
MKYDWTRAEAWGKIGATLVPSTAVYVAFCVFCVTALPVARDVGLAAGVLAGFPVWVGAAYYAVLARTVARAWIGPGVVALLLVGASLFAELVV